MWQYQAARSKHQKPITVTRSINQWPQYQQQSNSSISFKHSSEYYEFIVSIERFWRSSNKYKSRGRFWRSSNGYIKHQTQEDIQEVGAKFLAVQDNSGLRVSDLDSIRNSCYVLFWKTTSLSSSLRQWAWKDPEGCFVLRNRANQFTPSDPSQSEARNLRHSNPRFKRRSQLLFVQNLAGKEKEKIRDVEPQTNLAHTLAWNGDPCYWFHIWLWGRFQIIQ